MIKVNVAFGHPEYSDAALNSSISDILNKNILCAMATIKDTEAYVNTAYYCFNSSLTFYILAKPTTQHSQNLTRNPSVALAIYDSRQPWDDDKQGLQIFGEGRMVQGTELIEATKLYLQRFGGLKQWIQHPGDFAKGIINSKLYIVRTTWLKLFDEPNFGKENFISLTVYR